MIASQGRTTGVRAATSQRIVALVAFVTTCAASSAAQTLDEEFAAGELDRATWCPCQIHVDTVPLQFEEDASEPGDGILRIPVEPSIVGGNRCRITMECPPPAEEVAAAAAEAMSKNAEGREENEVLGPNLIRAFTAAAAAADASEIAPTGSPYCTPDVLERAAASGEEGECIQRQELRLEKALQHPASESFWYEIRFMMPDVIEDNTNSIRWVLAQWKQEPVSETYIERFGESWGPSPFLAQRFDDGVLHVTVQEEECRCIVASAPNPYGAGPRWEDGTPDACISTLETAAPGELCTPELIVTYSEDPVLTSPNRRWTNMRYKLTARRDGGTIEIFQDDRFIVRVQGAIGYDPHEMMPPFVKFKMGHYRDYMPFVHVMEIDAVRLDSASE